MGVDNSVEFNLAALIVLEEDQDEGVEGVEGEVLGPWGVSGRGWGRGGGKGSMGKGMEK